MAAGTSGETLQRLTAASGPGMCIPVRVVFTTEKEITPRASGKKFTMLQTYVVDGAGHYTFVQRRVFGDEVQRRRAVNEMRKKFFDGSVWVMSRITGVERNNPQYTCVSVPNIVTYDQVGRPNVTAHFTPQLASSEVAARLPKLIEPQESLADLRLIPDKRMVNFMALVVSTEAPSGMRQPMVKATFADFTGRIQVKFWGSDWQGLFVGKEGSVVCGFNFWASRAEATEVTGTSPALRALSSVEASHVLWPSEGDMPAGGKGQQLLKEREKILAGSTECFTDEGRVYEADSVSYESAEACATVAALMELANKYYQPLPDSLFQVQGAIVTVVARDSDGLCTKALR